MIKSGNSFIEELKWRNMLHDIIPGTEEILKKEVVTGYIGFDPTSDSLGVGNLVQIMTLLHFQKAGHKPIALIGGATGMVGDPSGKSEERNLLDENTLKHNLECQKKQLEKFLDFNCGANSAEIVNNYDWFKNYNFLDFIREIGKHITVNYMLAKDSVSKRLENGMSFTEFSYQLVQGYDFYWLYTNKNVKLQMGGSDQWGNIVTGTELIRRKTQGEAFALTTPLIKKADGTKFGKTESGNVWLDPKKTSPYKFYQFWLNASDDDAKNYIRIFTLFNEEEIIELEKLHNSEPHLRHLQKTLAKDITCRVHSVDEYKKAYEASQILFGKSTSESFYNIDEQTLLDIFEGVPSFNIASSEINSGINIVDFLTQTTNIFPSKSQAREMIANGGLSLNKEKLSDINFILNNSNLISNKYLIVQKGKKNYYLIICNV
ncbi:MAG: tyrosine--tRNA ligase [Bacteroidetes bacterium]|nr:tyrosine--tRNA ligase [Bacteroidota bacterium]